ncbi:MAG: hypothetical protein SH850_06435 [Planctomycetaceae bacterium]|nr:hypothetical protein [Planctomycetaceae bacterium]
MLLLFGVALPSRPAAADCYDLLGSWDLSSASPDLQGSCRIRYGEGLTTGELSTPDSKIGFSGLCGIGAFPFIETIRAGDLNIPAGFGLLTLRASADGQTLSGQLSGVSFVRTQFGTFTGIKYYAHDSPQISGARVVWRRYSNEYDHSNSVQHTGEIMLQDGATLRRLTDNDMPDLDPQISGTNIAWRGWDGKDHEIFFYNGSAITQLTNDTKDDQPPQISGSNVVWSDGAGAIYLDNGVTKTQITAGGGADPKVSGNNVAWRASDGTRTQIFLYNGVTVTQLTADTVKDKSAPQISGTNVVWSGVVDTYPEVYLYNGTIVTRLTNNSVEDRLPHISGGNVAWVGVPTGSVYDEALLYDGTQIRQLSTTHVGLPEGAVQISGTNVVWGNGNVIYFHNGTTATPIMPGKWPRISGSNVVSENTYNIYFYNGSTTTQLTNN